MPRIIVSVTLLILVAACSPIRTVTPLPPGIPPSAGPQGGSSPTVAAGSPQPAQLPPAGASPAPADLGPVTLQVLSPADGAVVNTSAVTVNGSASPGAVVTVNDDILVVGADGTFQSNVSLSEGLNLIEVIASNTSGSESSVELTVTYQP